MKERLRGWLERLIPSGSVADRTIKSGFWMSGMQVSNRVFQILMLIILARLLAPRHFGLLGIALVSLTATKQFTNIGVNAALVHNKDDDVDSYLDTTWCLEGGRGLLLFGILFIGAPYIAGFFNEPGATWVVRLIGLNPLLYGLRNPAVVYFTKDLAFHKEFVYSASGGLAQFVVGVGWALLSPTVWALVAAFVASELVRTILSYVLHGYRPWPSFDWDHARELVDYGKWITAGSIIYFLYSRGDDAFVGWFLSATALGFYQYAYQLADAPSTEVSETISRITFPAYAELQEDSAKLREMFLKTTRFTAFLAFPMALGIALVTPSFVPAVLGADWTPTILTMQLLAMYGLLHAITRNFGSLWKAIGRPDLTTKLGVVRVLSIGALIWPATAMWGIAGTAMTVVGVYLFPMLPLDVYFIARTTEIRIVEVLREFLYPAVAGGTMFGVLWLARSVLSVPPLVEFLLLIPAGVTLYAAVSLLLDRQFDWGMRRNLESILAGVAR